MAKPNDFWEAYIGRFWYFDVSKDSGWKNPALQSLAKMGVGSSLNGHGMGWAVRKILKKNQAAQTLFQHHVYLQCRKYMQRRKYLHCKPIDSWTIELLMIKIKSTHNFFVWKILWWKNDTKIGENSFNNNSKILDDSQKLSTKKSPNWWKKSMVH